ncbi:MAG: single-stranded-DNA-specific exonuclease RecJ [Chlorobiaceae bacterium]|nr:single-stranded-DNA-specific exonuclease RecJ [Chlorobiales bacterium]NTV26638.1 single-stranded-DNA-specific exonuclease RecJ [Chlorobiaceae bacterium]
MKRFRWTRLEPDESLVKELSTAINVSNSIAAALCNRGVTTFESARQFFRPSLDEVPSPFLLRDMEKAVARIGKAIGNGERMMVYGDYDVDGTTGTAMLSMFLEENGADVCHYINDRFREGYGLSPEGIAWAVEMQVKLIITVDCGIRAVEEVRQCADRGIEVIICDHHEADILPEAFAILDPKVEGCSYPFRELCGCGVALKLIQAMVETSGGGRERWMAYLDLVAVATAADMVSLQKENRTYFHEGLRRLRKSPRESFKAMASLMNIKSEDITMTGIAFGIAPRINAAGRMESARTAMQWLLAKDARSASDFASELEAMNTRRREIDAGIMSRADKMVAGHCASYCSSIVLYDEEWHLGVLGIVASKLLDKYALPTVIMGRMNGLVKGSVRSVGTVNIYDVLQECRDHLEQFGGHHQAAGLTLRPENLPAFRKRFDEVCRELITVEQRQREIVIDAELGIQDITPKFMNVLEQFSPFGFGNREPLFVSRPCVLSGKPRLLKDRHVKFMVKEGRSSVAEVIAFDRPDLYDDLTQLGADGRLLLAYIPERKQWNGREYLQLRLKDMEVC